MPKRVLKDVELKWCNFTSKDQYGCYSAKLILNTENVAKMHEWKLETKKDEDGDFYQIRRNKGPDGTELPAPIVVGPDMAPITGVQVGNGSIANVLVDVYPYKAYGGGIACRLESVQVTSLVPYGDDESLEPVADAGSSEGAPKVGGDDVPF